MSLKVFVTGAVAACLIGAGSFYYYTTTPTYSALMVRQAVKQHDVELFEKHVDVDTVLNRLIDDIFAQKMQSMTEQTSEPANNLASTIGMGLVQLVKPNLVNGLKTATLRYIETGEMEKPVVNDANAQTSSVMDNPANTSLSGLMTQLGIKNDDDLKFEVKREGKTAVVSMPFKNKQGLELQLDIRMRERGSYWQVVELSNVTELLVAIENEHKKRQAEERAKLIASWGWAIHLALLSDAQKASNLVSTVKGYGESAFIMKSSDGMFFKVMAGPYQNEEAANAARESLLKKGNIHGFVVSQTGVQ